MHFIRLTHSQKLIDIAIKLCKRWPWTINTSLIIVSVVVANHFYTKATVPTVSIINHHTIRVVRRTSAIFVGICTLFVTAVIIYFRFIASKKACFHWIMSIINGFAMLFGWSVEGLENIPPSGKGLIVLYHGIIPLDSYFIIPAIFNSCGRRIYILGADFLFKVPILGYFCKIAGAVPAAMSSAAELLQANQLVLVSPGGVRESVSGTHNDYIIDWSDRLGFAKLAVNCNSPIYLMATRNIRHVFWTPFASLSLVQWVYQTLKIPLASIFALGPFPVHLTSFISPPIDMIQAVGNREATESAAIDHVALVVANLMQKMVWNIQYE